MTIREKLKEKGISQTAFAKRYGIPLRTVQGWCLGQRNPAEWLKEWILEKIDLMAGEREGERQ